MRPEIQTNTTNRWTPYLFITIPKAWWTANYSSWPSKNLPWGGSKPYLTVKYIPERNFMTLLPSNSPPKNLTQDNNCPRQKPKEEKSNPQGEHKPIHQGSCRSRQNKWWLQCWIFEKGLRVNCMFCEKLGMYGARGMGDLLSLPFFKPKIYLENSKQ